MKQIAPKSLTARTGGGLWAGGTVGLLTGLCYLLLFGGLDFSRGNPLYPLVRLPSGLLGLVAALVAVGAGVGAVVSLATPDD